MKVYNDIEATGFVKTNGTSEEVLCADGSTTAKVTKTSQLENDSNFSSLPDITKVSEGFVFDNTDQLKLKSNRLTLEDGTKKDLDKYLEERGSAITYYATLELLQDNAGTYSCKIIGKEDYPETVQSDALILIDMPFAMNNAYIKCSRSNIEKMPTKGTNAVSIRDYIIYGFGNTFSRITIVDQNYKILVWMRKTTNTDNFYCNILGIISSEKIVATTNQIPTVPTKTSELINDSKFSNGVITGKHNVVDLRTAQGFDENTFYPVTIAMQDTTIKGSSNVRIRVMHDRDTLSASERPAWMTNSQGVTLCTEWEIGFGDYTIAGFSNRLIYNNQWWYANTNPCRKPVIFQNTNTETFYLRGGGKYDIYTNIDVTINFGASIQLDGSNTLTAIQTDGTTTDIESKVTAFPQEVKKQSTAGLVRGTNKVMMEFSEEQWDMLNKELKNAVIEKVATMPTTNHIQGRVVTSGATGRQKLYLNIGNGWDLMASEFWASSNFVRKTEMGSIMYDISNYTTSDLTARITTNLGSGMLYHHILLTTNTQQIDVIPIPLATIYATIAGRDVLRLKNKKFIIDFPNAVAGDYSKETGIPFIVDFGRASTHNDRYEPMVFNAYSNTNLVPELHFTLVSNNTFVWVEDVRVYFKEK